jgi:hypothetical protein
MADLRRWILALAVLSLFAGLASAQVQGGGSALTCSVTSTPLSIRQEGVTEQVGDILIRCTGGQSKTPGSAVGQANVIVTLPYNVTSRIIASGGITDALLLVDEPQSGLTPVVPGFGPAQNVAICNSPTTGCPAFVGTATGGTTTLAVSVSGASVCSGAGNTGCTGPNAAANAYQGVWNSSFPTQLTFFGVPVLAPVTSGVERVFRIVNVRMNATGAALLQVINAQVASSDPSVLPINQTNGAFTVAQVQQGLTTSSKTVTSLNQCSSPSKQLTSLMTFNEGFPSAFKTRLLPQSNTAYAGQNASYNQNVPGTVYNSESGFTIKAGTAGYSGSSGAQADIGLSDFGTRLKATFTNLPAGAKIFVSAANTDSSGNAVAPPSPIGGNTTSISYAQLVTSETVSDGTTFPAATASGGLVEITPSSGTTASATWEVVNTNPFGNESFTFAVYVSYTGVQATNTPPAGNTQVALSFGSSTNPVAAPTASSTAPVPRFLDTSSPKTAFSIIPCRTILLFPFVTNTNGFDTGIAISNTSTDPFGTTPQAGTCQSYWYGSGAPATNPTAASANVATGTTLAYTTSSIAPGFQGYMIAICNFQYAHGFAFVSQFGNAFNGTMGYLPLVVPDPTLQGGVGRQPNPFNPYLLGSGEQIAP